MKFTPEEIEYLERDPEALRSVANYHHGKAGELAIFYSDFNSEIHEHVKRAKELNEEVIMCEANKLLVEYER